MNILKRILNYNSSRKTITHPDFAGKIQQVFKIERKRYYIFNPEKYGELDMPIGRYFYASVFYKELEHKFDFNDLDNWLDLMIQDCNNGRLDMLILKLSEMRKRTKLLFDPEIVFKLASVMIMDDTEDVNTYDIEYNRKKIDLFKKHKGLAFFLSRPTSEYLSLKNISEHDIKNFLAQVPKITRDLENIEKVMSLKSEPTSQ